MGHPGRRGHVGRVLAIDGSPHAATLRGVVEHGDVVVAEWNGGRHVYRNAGTAKFLDWREGPPSAAAVR